MNRIDDMDQALADMQRLDDEAGIWCRHLPYEALAGWKRSLEIRVRFREHVKSCSFCREAIETLSQPIDR